MAKVHIHIEGESAADATKELVSLAALVQGAALGGLIDEGADVGETTAAPKGRGPGRPKRDTATPTEPAAAPPATPASAAGSTNPPSAVEPASAPAPAGTGQAAPATASPSELQAGEITIQHVLGIIQELSAKKIDAADIQAKVKETFGVERIGMIPKEKLPEVVTLLRSMEAAQSLI